MHSFVRKGRRSPRLLLRIKQQPFFLPQFTEGLVIAIACLLGRFKLTLLALVPTLRAAATALNEVALLAEASKRKFRTLLAAVRVSVEPTDALEEVGDRSSQVTGAI